MPDHVALGGEIHGAAAAQRLSLSTACVEILDARPGDEGGGVEQTEETPSKEVVSDQTMTMLKNILEYPDQLDDPLELGELLFASGNTNDAVVCYQEALKRTDPNDVRLSQDRAWILFQIGNCLRNHEPATAAETYRKLLDEYPNSLWTDLAKAQKDLVDWMLIEKPRELIVGPEAGANVSNEN